MKSKKTLLALAVTFAFGSALLCVSSVQATVVIDTISIGNVGNADDTHGDGYGGVDYTYNIGTYEVTAGQYAEFLNATAATDTYNTYNTKMGGDSRGCQIKRAGSVGTYTYSVASDWANRPVNYLDWGDAARFTNWLHNGQPTGAQDDSTTEDGAYDLNGATENTPLLAVTRESDWKWAIPTEDEWYKAAFHKNDGVTGNYYDYATSSDILPSNLKVEPTDPGNNATFYTGGVWTIGNPYKKTEVGVHENSDSPYGTFDQAGNIHEWNETLRSATQRGTRGGGYTNADGYMTAANRMSSPPATLNDYLGFRVAQVPETATLPEVGVAITTGFVDNVVGFTFDSEAGKDYQLECTTDNVNWTARNFTIHGLGQTETVFDTTGFDSNKNYRVVTLP